MLSDEVDGVDGVHDLLGIDHPPPHRAGRHRLPVYRVPAEPRIFPPKAGTCLARPRESSESKVGGRVGSKSTRPEASSSGRRARGLGKAASFLCRCRIEPRTPWICRRCPRPLGVGARHEQQVLAGC